MVSHTPRLRYSFACFFIAFGFFSLNVYIFQWFIVFFGVLLTCIGMVEVVFVYIHNAVDARERNYRAQVEVINALSGADPETRASFGSWFPQYNFVYTDEAKLYWQNTTVPLEIFAEFMRESNDKYTVAQRVWKEKGGQYWNYWKQIYKKLLECGLVMENQSAGSHSEVWRGNGYKRAYEMWIYNMPRLNRLQETE